MSPAFQSFGVGMYAIVEYLQISHAITKPTNKINGRKIKWLAKKKKVVVHVSLLVSQK